MSNFSATVHQAGTLKYDDGQIIDRQTGANGLILAVPLLKGTDGEWHALYGSNMMGFHDVENWDTTDELQGQRRAILEAALYQIFGAQHEGTQYVYKFPQWYLEWNEESARYEGTLLDLPGEATRYYWASNSPDADLTVAYYFLDLEALEAVFGDLTGKSSQEKLAAISRTIQEHAGDDITSAEVKTEIRRLVEQIDADGTKNFALLDVADFNRVFSSRIYVPNVSPELAVLKLDEKGNPLEGATFALYKGDDKPDGTTAAVASGTTDAQGLLVFSAGGTGKEGSAKVTFEPGSYWVQETTPPQDYNGNSEYIPVYVTDNGRVYADALEKEDGITVRKGLGRLLETMVRYAAQDSVNVTLRDITATLVTGNTWEEVRSAISTSSSDQAGQSVHLHYGLDNALLEYGTHEVNGIAPNPYFEVDEDIAGILVQQNYRAHEGETMYSTVAAKTDLEDTNIRNLFTGSTTIVVRNRKQGSLGSFSVTKTVTGSDITGNETFLFDLAIDGTGGEGSPWQSGEADYLVTDEKGTLLEKGALTFAGQDDERFEITAVVPEPSGESTEYFVQESGRYRLKLKDGQKLSVEGIPFGLNVTVTEAAESAAGYITTVTVNDGERNRATTASGVVKQTVGDPSFHFYNHKDKSADLTLQKTLPEEPDNSTKFPFTIRLWSQDGGNLLTDSYGYTITGKDGTSRTGTIEGGQATVELGHQETLVIQNLPVGTRYIIQETTKGYAPSVTINGTPVTPVDGTVSGTVAEITTEPAINTVVYSNKRSGSITITKRSGLGTLLSGAGFTLYTVDDQGNLTPYSGEQKTALAMRHSISENDSNFDKDSMRYNVGTDSYIVHTTAEQALFYYRFLTEKERDEYYAGTLSGMENVEAVVQFTELSLNNVYALRETTVPEGYVQNADFEKTMSDIHLPFQEEGSADKVYDVLYTVTNHKKMVLPVTGLGGIKGPLAAGLLLMALAGMLLWTANRKKPARTCGKGGDSHSNPSVKKSI